MITIDSSNMSLVNLSRSALALLLAASTLACPTKNNSTASQAATGKVATGYFAGYHANRTGVSFGVDQIQWDRFDDVKYAFAETTASGGLDLSQSAPDQLPKFVEAAHAHNVKAQVAIGGWSGSIYFSSSLGSPENRTAFVKTCLDLVQKYNLDGIDFDWEYPNKQGLGCNTINANDTDNFISFLTELRKSQPKQLLLTAAVSLYPYNDASGQQSTNLKALGDVLDYSVVMGYDLYGAWASTGGPNAPLEMSCDSRNNQGGIKEGIAKWIAAGFPAEKTILGVGAYGHGFTIGQSDAFVAATAGATPTLSAYPKNNGTRRQGGSWDDDPATDQCGNAQPHGGTFTFWSMVTEGKFLDESGNPRSGIASGYDNCSQTPYLYDNSSSWWVSYDNVQSLTAKGKYITDNKLAGFSVWEIGGDYKNIVVNAMRSSVGLKV
ncbi:uncharacterized protein PgNI_02870 [Pyricularia grisea]|uniref:chitinase n=1 Tax=Pyricularia grisea TaxID=148305 RepID=A0A6P8BEE6_PYRGI|nr:uncharacterized protein PgNI_02870 [Pyricularia grisea]TLD14170.1 hypothetical protein PgNI_02870 [Pyricularia grisea]